MLARISQKKKKRSSLNWPKLSHFYFLQTILSCLSQWQPCDKFLSLCREISNLSIVSHQIYFATNGCGFTLVADGFSVS